MVLQAVSGEPVRGGTLKHEPGPTAEDRHYKEDMHT